MSGPQFVAMADLLAQVRDRFMATDEEVTMSKFREMELERQRANAQEEMALISRRCEDRLLAAFWGGLGLGAVAVAAVWVVFEVVR